MDVRAGEPSLEPRAIVSTTPRGRLFRKYVLLFAGIVSAALIASGLLDIWFSYREQSALLIRIQREQADAAAAKISQFVKEIEGQMGWTTQLAWSAGNIEQRRLEALRLLRQVPAITELALLDPSGREQLRVSRVAMDLVASDVDRSREPAFVETMANKSYYGPVYFRHESEPYMTVALAGARRDAGVSIAEINLRLIWDVVSQIKVGDRGQVYVVDGQGRLIAHHDISLVLSNSDFSHVAQVRTALAASPGLQSSQEPFESIQGERVLAVHAVIAPLGWLVIVELPVAEAYAPIYASILRAGAVLAVALGLAGLAGLMLARRMVVPIEALQQSAARIGHGDLGQRITIKTGDELEALGEQFNSMAEQLERSYGTLERKVQERTHELESANLAKSRFLAAASHDLRQPLHALGLFVSQLREHLDSPERDRVVGRIDTAIAAMNELFNALLDVSKLDAGVLTPDLKGLQIQHLLDRIEITFASAARHKGIRLRVVPSLFWVRSDPILLERILLNLVSNAVRYTTSGGIVVGCRRRGTMLRIEVADSGPGIPEDQRRKIFSEFYRLADAAKTNQAGLGLGLAIVERLCALLDHQVELASTPGKGSRFSVTVPTAPAAALKSKPSQPAAIDVARGKLVVVIDNDTRVLEGMGGLLRNWGCRVVTAATPEAALTDVSHISREARPDLIISDYHLADGQSGITAIAKLREVYGAIPAFVMSGDTAPERLREVQERGHHLLHKPVQPMTLRAMMSRFLKSVHA
jgi:signal transduction histidine kinase